MELFHWDRSFDTGLASVDQQHHALVDLINRFGELLSQDSVSSEDIDGGFKQLADYAKHHFRDEEAMMAEVGIDARHRDPHIENHHQFLEEIAVMYAGIGAGNTTARDLLNFLIHWLAYHILGEDQGMARQVVAIRSGADPASAYDEMNREKESATEPLLNALSGLFSQVSARNAELLRLNQSLEAKVLLRTRALSEANRRLEELSLTDVLTGLPNRRHAMQQLSLLWDESIAKGTELVCMMIDADHFKQVNDIYGHDVGDQVLRQLALTMKYAIRSDDCLCRLGGDEFLVICPATGEQGGMLVGETIRKTVSGLKVKTGGDPWCGSVSVGVAHRKTGIASHEALIKAADEGVYAAKKAGKNCVRMAG